MPISALQRLFWLGCFAVLSGMIPPGSAIAEAAASSPARIAAIDLSKPFNTLSPWSFVATQGPEVPDPVYPDTMIPGIVTMCLRAGPAAACDPGLAGMQPPEGMPALWWEAHFLNTAQLVYPRGRGAAPLLMLQTAGVHSGDGDQSVFTQLLAYSPPKDRFKQVYSFQTGHNNNQDVRFIASGPLQGSVISVEPTNNSPFGYWVTVNRPTANLTYKQVLRYRSGTLYNDGNSLAVIDSEMANIERRLGLWRGGLPLPVPMSVAHPCETPRLSHMELWCR